MLSTPHVSVILPTYNRAHLVERALASVLNQGYRDFELLVVDDGSRDDTANVVQNMSDPRIRYIRHETNRGVSAARNTGIKAAQGYYIGFQDSDDYWLPTKLEEQVTLLHKFPEVGVVYTSLVKKCGDREVIVPERNASIKSGSITNELLFRNLVGTPTALVKRALFGEYGGFDETMSCYEDWELWLRLSKHTTFLHLPEPFVVSPFTPYGVNDQNKQKLANAMLHIYDKNLSDYEAHTSAKAELLYVAGTLLCQGGDVTKGRGHLLHALQTNPRRFKYLAALALSSFGSNVYRTLVNLKTRAPDARRRGNHAEHTQGFYHSSQLEWL